MGTAVIPTAKKVKIPKKVDVRILVVYRKENRIGLTRRSKGEIEKVNQEWCWNESACEEKAQGFVDNLSRLYTIAVNRAYIVGSQK